MASSQHKARQFPFSIDRDGDVLQRLRDALGIRRLRTERDLVSLVERGLPIRCIDALRRAGFTQSEVHSVLISRRALMRHRAHRHRLSQTESDRAVRLARITVLAEAIFADPARSWRWLRTQKRAVGGRKPLELLATEAGGRLVEEWLYRIDDGMAA